MSEAIINSEDKELGVFLNKYSHNLDPKKRITIPSGWRRLIGFPERIFLLPGINESCIKAFPAREMIPLLERLRRRSPADKKARQLARVLGYESEEVNWDAQGRIRIKDELLQCAKLDSTVLMVGTINGFELWNPDLWKANLREPEHPDLGDAMNYVWDLGEA